MRFRFTRAVAALSLAFGGLAATTDTSAVRPEPFADRPSGPFKPAYTPRGLNGAMVTLVVQLAGDPVAVRQGNAGRDLSDTERDQIKTELSARQDPLRARIAQLGGTVIATYQSSYNGIKVRIPADKAEQLQALPNVVAVRSLQVMKPNNERGVPLIGGPSVWNTNFRGDRVKIAILDTGIDYTHANFGGPGTTAAYEAAHANETALPDPMLFGPRSPRVKGGIDLVGDSYDADSDSDTYQPIPHPDPNPLDCQGHGSHVAGSAAGSGVTLAGATYTGPYNATTISGNSWRIAPGVAPRADLYAVRVFGCNGSTDVVVDALEWAVNARMDVVNMSLGSSFGSKDDPSAEAATNAAKAGIVVVASAGNSNNVTYITGSPATGDGSISVAASDPTASYPGATITGHAGGPTDGINANGAALPAGPFTIKVIGDAVNSDTQSLGCSVADFGGPLPANTIAVVNRGVCARVAKAIFGQQAGAAAVIMINNSTGLPPFEGPITSNPDDGTPYTVTIPLIGVKGLPATATSDGGELARANGQTITSLTAITLSNTNFKGFASFTSAGPRRGDSFLKPEITGPGVSIVSTDVGSGNGAATMSGTSMAAPHVAGLAALARQAHPTWSADEVKAAIVNTGSPADVLSYKTSRGGSGLAQAVGATKTQVIARIPGDKLSNALNFGYVEVGTTSFSQTKQIVLQNKGSTTARFTAAQANAQGRTHTVSITAAAARGAAAGTITVPPGGQAMVSVALTVTAANIGSTAAFREVAGNIVFTPVGTDNGGVTLRMPYYLVGRATSNVATSVPRMPGGVNPSVPAKITNVGGARSGNADLFAWGLEAGKKGTSAANIRAVGVQSYDFGGGFGQGLGFAVNTHNRWSTPSYQEFDIYVDVDGDGIDDYIVIGFDYGYLSAGAFDGQYGSWVFSTLTGEADIFFLADAPTDSSTAVLYVTAEMLCRPDEPCLDGVENTRISYRAVGFDFDGGVFSVPGRAKYNVWDSSLVGQGDFFSVAPGATVNTTIGINSAEHAVTPALGAMVVTIDNKAGAPEAQLIKLAPGSGGR